MAALQTFALKQANDAQASVVGQLLQGIAPPAASPPHLGNRVDASA